MRFCEYLFLFILFYIDISLLRTLERHDFLLFKAANLLDAIIAHFYFLLPVLIIPHFFVYNLQKRPLTFRKCIKYGMRTQFFGVIFFILLDAMIYNGNGHLTSPGEFYVFSFFFCMFMGVFFGALYVWLDSIFSFNKETDNESVD